MKKLLISFFLITLLWVPGWTAENSGSSAASGAAGGVLSGTYPNPTLSTGANLPAAQITGTLSDSNLATISTAGKVSGNAITSGTIGGSTAINTTGVGTLGAIRVGNITGSLEGNCIDVLQASDVDIVDNATMSLVFKFEPSTIVLNWSGACRDGTAWGTVKSTCVVRVVSPNAITSNYFGTVIYNNGILQTQLNGDTTNVFRCLGGVAAAPELKGTATWTSATNTLLINFQETSTTTASNWAEVTAIAYR